MTDGRVDIEELVELRRALHRRPELSGEERETARTVADFLERCAPDALHLGLGGEGVAAVFEGAAAGPAVLVRCDLDALPIEEELAVPHRSEVSGVSHKCGHDGHMAIVSGLARGLSAERPRRGRVILLFQPAEETGAGARLVLDDPAFAPLRPDLALALHNLPGFPLGQVVVGSGVFASASRGLVATFAGRTSHAGEPERGRSPALATAQLVEGLAALPQQHTALDEAALVTVVGARLGERAFGTSPGHAEVYATFRAHRDETMSRLWARARRLVEGLAAAHELEADLEAVEDFPATVNDPRCVAAVSAAASTLGVPLVEVEGPFPWSEDFGHFGAACPSALFGLGAGEDRPALHNPDYDFPDELLATGVALLTRAVEQLLGPDERPIGKGRGKADS